MDICIARQPIFDKSMEVCSHELLFRANGADHYDALDANQATASILADMLNSDVFPTLTNGQRCAINFTPELIINDVASLFPAEKLTIELDASVTPDDALLQACLHLQQSGYLIALDNFLPIPQCQPLLPYANMLKVDFRTNSPDARHMIMKIATRRKIKLVADKVETDDEFKMAKAIGYDYFQGFFFCRPVLAKTNDIAPNKLNLLELIRQVNEGQVDIDAIEAIIRRDLSLSIKLLKLLNSPAVGVRKEIHSIRHAITLLGAVNTRKWITIVALNQIGAALPLEVMRFTLIRSTLCELIAEVSPKAISNESAYLVGAFSLLDTITGKPLPEVVTHLSLADDIKMALIHGEGDLGATLKLIEAYELARWEQCDMLCIVLGIKEEQLPALYLTALNRTKEIIDQLSSER